MSSSGISSAGKAKYAAWAVLFIVNLVVLGLSASVNKYQEFYYVADLFPLALSIIVLVLMVFLSVIDMVSHNSFTARPASDLVFLFVFSIFWMIFNAFSTNRWGSIPMTCSSIPAEFADERSWCTNVQALKGMVWVEWVGFFLTAVLTLRYVLAQNSAGRRHIWRTPISRYSPSASPYGGFAGSNNNGNNYNGNNADFSGHMAFNGAPATAFEQQYYGGEQGQQQQQQQQYYGQNDAPQSGLQYHYQQPQQHADHYRGQTGYGATAHTGNGYNAY